MTAAYNDRLERAARLVTLGGVPVFQTASGKVIALFPIGYLAWTAASDTIFRRIQAGFKGSTVKRELWLGAAERKLVKETLGKGGWIVREKVGDNTGGRS